MALKTGLVIKTDMAGNIIGASIINIEDPSIFQL